jgi:L-fucose/D-arabinose isomerase
MNKIVDIYMPLDGRAEPNRVVWPIATAQLKELVQVIERNGWKANILNPEAPVSSVVEGIRVIQKAKGSRFINFIAGWAYPDFTVTPMWQLEKKTPKLMIGSLIPDFPGAVGLLAAASGLEQVGIATSRLFVERFEDHADYEAAVASFLKTGRYAAPQKKTVPIPVSASARAAAKKVKERLKGSVYGAVGPRSMQMWNKISEADFLSVFGIAREGFDGLRLLKMAEKVPDARAEAALNFLFENGMDVRLGTDPATELTREMVLFQMKVYFAMLELKKQYGLDFAGVQDQLDWIDHYPATDLTLGLLNNKLRPESDGETFVVATEADDGAALTLQVLKLLSGGQPAGFNDLRCWDPRQGLYWFVNSGALAPYFARGSHRSFEGAWTERQTPIYFKNGGGTCSVVVRKPGVVTWARFSYRDHKLYLCAGRGVTDVPTEQQWKERSARCSANWPHWYLKLCGRIEDRLNTNHPMTACGDYLAELKALAAELGIGFECYDHLTPEQIQQGKPLSEAPKRLEPVAG